MYLNSPMYNVLLHISIEKIAIKPDSIVAYNNIT